MWFIMVYCLIANESLLFSQTIFSLLLLHVEQVCRVQVAHLHNTARALSSRIRCVQL